MSLRKIGIVTSNRADFGLLKVLAKKIDAEAEFDLQLFVTGSHLSSDFGKTVTEIEESGLKNIFRIEILDGLSSSNDAKAQSAMIVGRVCERFSLVLQEHRPDILVVLGDRFEILGAAQTAILLGIPLAHIHGGEVTYGAIDDSLRHAISKLAHLHFVAAEEYKKRILQLGESEERVFVTGTPALDELKHSHLLTKKDLEESLGIELTDHVFLVTYHPTTLLDEHVDREIFENLLASLKKLEGANVVMTKPNFDHGGAFLSEMAEEACIQMDNWHFTPSLGHHRFLSLVSISTAIVGNSSAGVIEVPFLGVPTVNIGPRQDGRLRSFSVTDCPSGKIEEIDEALKMSLNEEFRIKCQQQDQILGGGDASLRIFEVLRDIQIGPDFLVKKFVDRNFS